MVSMTKQTTTGIPFPRASRRRVRGVVMIEFMLLLPLFMFICLFTVDLGRLVVVSGAVNDATYVAARSGAQRGSATEGDNAQITFEKTIKNIPGAAKLPAAEFTVIDGDCTTSSSYIVVEARQSVPLITPGMNELMNVFTGGSLQNPGYMVSSRGVVLCEIIR